MSDQDIINQASRAEKTTPPPAQKQVATGPPPQKKQKTIQGAKLAAPVPFYDDDTEEEEEEEPKTFFSFLGFGKTNDKALRNDLKRLLLKHPGVELGQYTEIDQFVNSLDTKTIISYLDEARFKIQQGQPKNINGLSFLAGIGDALDYYCGKKGLAKTLLNDEELVSMVDDIVPDDLTWMSGPFRVISKIYYHLRMHE